MSRRRREGSWNMREAGDAAGCSFMSRLQKDGKRGQKEGAMNPGGGRRNLANAWCKPQTPKKDLPVSRWRKQDSRLQAPSQE
ncbi:hypothetical protein chiPu_0016746 [Chiloscyllium punctatum]|uniref:Uncharacterized protein n=1 Tax=Chiloscyllium punctatum TaxID=137246 RepID=A0A401T6L7_CHIPU|nr:hypothetical protein [Chiloscyllium punctatum]